VRHAENTYSTSLSGSHWTVYVSVKDAALGYKTIQLVCQKTKKVLPVNQIKSKLVLLTYQIY